MKKMLKCADCDDINPQWGSLNRGVVLCDDCSSVHRHLGRHISQVKHLTQSRWRKTQLTMLKALSHAGANKYWEHLILAHAISQPPKDNSGFTLKIRKPSPNDAIHTTKSDFIKEKYLFFGFFKKPRSIVTDDLNQQLHASVRTGIIETSLYLLTLGAQPNYTHPTKHSTPLHVATAYNQPLQVELLLTYGADLLLTDDSGDTALQIAHKKSQSCGEPLKWQVLISCLLEAQYEITDTLSYYLCRQTIDHSLSDLNNPSKMLNNFLIPKLTGDKMIINSKQDLEAARCRLQHLPNGAFVDLCLDICDEIDRRDTNDIVSSLNHDDQLHLFFLPPNANYSPTRNQGRQKLARLSIQEFRTLCHDVLVEASVRMCPAVPLNQLDNAQRSEPKNHRSSLALGLSLDSCLVIDEPDHIYDQVPADIDSLYAMDLHRPQETLLPSFLNGQKDINKPTNQVSPRVSMSIEMLTPSSMVQSLDRQCEYEKPSFNNLFNKIDDMTGRNKLLQLRNNELEKKVKYLELQICQLKDEKSALIVTLLSNKSGNHDVPSSTMRAREQTLHTNLGNSSDYEDNLEVILRQVNLTKKPAVLSQTVVTKKCDKSVYSTGSDLFSSGPWLRQEVVFNGGQLQSNHGSNISSVQKKTFENSNTAGADYPKYFSPEPVVLRYYNKNDDVLNQPMRVCSERRENSSSNSPPSLSNSNTSNSQYSSNQSSGLTKNHKYHVSSYENPPMDEFFSAKEHTSNQVVNIVETIILQIRLLLDIANGKRAGDFLQCSRTIQSAVQLLVRLFSSRDRRYLNNPVLSIQTSAALRDLLANSRDLRIICEKKCKISTRNGVPSGKDIDTVIKHAHGIAGAAKMLLNYYQHDEI